MIRSRAGSVHAEFGAFFAYFKDMNRTHFTALIFVLFFILGTLYFNTPSP